MNVIFVYGTLKRTYGNYTRYIHADNTSEFIDEAKSVDSDYTMLCYGAPTLYEGVLNGHPVKGELFRVSDEALARIDRLEGHPRVYRRSQRFFTTTDGSVYKAWVYLAASPYSGGHKYPPPLNEVNQLVWPRPELPRKLGPVEITPNTNKMYRDLSLVLDDIIDFEDIEPEDRRRLSPAQRTAISALSCGDFTITIAEDGSSTISIELGHDYSDEELDHINGDGDEFDRDDGGEIA